MAIGFFFFLLLQQQSTNATSIRTSKIPTPTVTPITTGRLALELPEWRFSDGVSEPSADDGVLCEGGDCGLDDGGGGGAQTSPDLGGGGEEEDEEEGFDGGEEGGG